MENKIFKYNGNNITFQLGNGNVMVNATEMAKNFGKSSKDYLRTQQSSDLLEALCKRLKCPLTDLLMVSKGGNDSGTWMHEDIALDFAQWLSVDFKLWCNDRVKEIMKHGFTATESKLEELANNPDLLISLAYNLKQERAEKERLQIQNEYQAKELKQSAPKVAYYENVLQSKSTYTTSQIAKELGLSAVNLNKKLHELGVQYRQSETWLLYAKHQDKDFTKTKTHVFEDSNGQKQTSMLTVWTEKGREFVHDMVLGSKPKTSATKSQLEFV
jgi:phage antirepressor YoqD-like protein